MTVNYDEPPYDPFGDRGDTHYKPTNEGARRVYALGLIHGSLDQLCLIYKGLSDPRQEKLHLRYIWMELLPQERHLRRLRNIIMKEYGDSGADYPVAELKAAMKEYDQWFSPREKTLRLVRNTITAHFGENTEGIGAEEAAEAWDKLTLDGMNDLFRIVHKLFNLMRKFPVDNWFKRGTEGELAFVQAFKWSGCTVEKKDGENPSDQNDRD